MTPKLSILLPTYNAGRFLAHQVQSILEQRFGDFELIAIDDGSTDGTRDRLHEFAATDGRIRVLPSTGNRGQKQRLVEAAAMAQAQLLSVADQDDVWHEDKLSLLLHSLNDRAMVFGPSWIIDADGRERGFQLLDMMPPLPQPDDKLTYLMRPMVSAHAMIVRRELFTPSSLQRAHHFDWLQALDAIFSRGVTYVPEAITYHRLHGGNQNNGDGHVPNLWERLTLTRLKRRQIWRYMERWEFVQRLEHLAFSSVIDPALNTLFRRAHKLCVAAWYEPDRPIGLSDPTLTNQMMSLLGPLAASERDLEFSRQRMWRMACSPWRPYDTARNLAAAVFHTRHKALRNAVGR